MFKFVSLQVKTPWSIKAESQPVSAILQALLWVLTYYCDSMQPQHILIKSVKICS